MARKRSHRGTLLIDVRDYQPMQQAQTLLKMLAEHHRRIAEERALPRDEAAARLKPPQDVGK
jgi:hypothetical protein